MKKLDEKQIRRMAVRRMVGLETKGVIISALFSVIVAAITGAFFDKLMAFIGVLAYAITLGIAAYPDLKKEIIIEWQEDDKNDRNAE